MGPDDPRELKRAQRYRMKAEELRTVADQAVTPQARSTYRGLAETYDRLADDAERRDSAEYRPRPRTG